MFGLGTIKCCSADKTLGDFEIKNIKKSKDVKEILSEMVEEERNRKKVTKAGYPYFIEISGFSSGSYSDYFLVTEASLF